MKRRQPAGHLRKIPALDRLRRWIRFRLIVPVFRSPHSAAHTARGVANGVFWGLTPTIGLQTFAILATWYVARKVFRRESSLVQALVWVWINNPLTMLPMFYGFYLTGLWLMGASDRARGYEAFGDLFGAAEAGWFTGVIATAGSVGVPLLIGCVPYAAAGAALSYRWALALVTRRRQRLARRREKYDLFRTSDSSG